MRLAFLAEPLQGRESRMSSERQVMEGYLDALVKRADFPAYFTDDVVATFEGPISAPSAGRPPGS